MLPPCWIETVHLDEFGPIYEMRKLPQSRALFGGLPGPHPAEAAPVWRICPYHSRLNLYGFGAYGFFYKLSYSISSYHTLIFALTLTSYNSCTMTTFWKMRLARLKYKKQWGSPITRKNRLVIQN